MATHHRNRRRRRKHWSRSWWFIFSILVVLAGLIDIGLATYHLRGGVDGFIEPPPSPTAKSELKPATGGSQTSPASPSPFSLPASANLTVPFQVQAPFANWDALHEDACEETSLLMVKHYLAGTAIGTQEEADRQIIDLVHYGEQNGYGISITLEELRKIANGYYGLSSGHIEKNVTVEGIKREIAEGRPVIIPAAGKLLPNPHFSNGGPVYHMLVVIGYDEQGFITNDPGIRQGEGFRYTTDKLYEAIHDWNPANILDGEKAYLVFG